jgi:hypothetical protein
MAALRIVLDFMKITDKSALFTRLFTYGLFNDAVNNS